MQESILCSRNPIPYRWVICALLFFATTSNYIDRQLLGLLAPVLQGEIGWSERQYSYIVTSFQGAYALGLLASGYLIDRIGTKKGLSLAVAAWSLASMAHGFAATVVHFSVARFCLGLAEAGNFPASIKAVAEWFPKRERAFGIGVFNSGSNVAAIVTPLVVPVVVDIWGWRAAFLLTGALGCVWLVLAAWLFHAPEVSPFVSAHERELIQSEREPMVSTASWKEALALKETWGFAIAKFLTDPIWWFYLYWAPKYFNSRFGVELAGLAAPLVFVYVMADFGSIGGGWWSAKLIKRGKPVLWARKYVMLCCALSVLTVIFSYKAPTLWVAACILGLATAAHQGWSANLFASVSDTFPRESVASVVGFGGMAGALGGMLISLLTGWVLERTGSYALIFSLCGSAYVVAWMFFHVLVKDRRRVEEESQSLKNFLG